MGWITLIIHRQSQNTRMYYSSNVDSLLTSSHLYITPLAIIMKTRLDSNHFLS